MTHSQRIDTVTYLAHRHSLLLRLGLLSHPSSASRQYTHYKGPVQYTLWPPCASCNGYVADVCTYGTSNEFLQGDQSIKYILRCNLWLRSHEAHKIPSGLEMYAWDFPWCISLSFLQYVYTYFFHKELCNLEFFSNRLTHKNNIFTYVILMDANTVGWKSE